MRPVYYWEVYTQTCTFVVVEPGGVVERSALSSGCSAYWYTHTVCGITSYCMQSTHQEALAFGVVTGSYRLLVVVFACCLLQCIMYLLLGW
jgi:hypothetical protein